MPRVRLFWKLYLVNVCIAFVLLGSAVWYVTASLSRFYITETRRELTARAALMKQLLPATFAAQDYKRVDSLCKKAYATTQTRFTIILPSGRVIGDSEANPDSMENHGSRPEIIAALSGASGFARRQSYSLQQAMMYVAVAQTSHDTITAIVRASVPLNAMARIINSVYRHILFAGIILAFLGAFFAWIATRLVSRPIETITARAMEVAGTEKLSHNRNSGEVGQLAGALDSMATRLKRQFDQITSQKNEQEAILAGMVEGVVALDSREKIIMLNHAAALLLGVTWEQSKGKWINEIVRNSDLLTFVERAIKTDRIIEDDLTLSDVNQVQHSVQAHGSTLNASDGSRMGALIVLNDVTRLKKLETVRRDFVANVSHELKTPLTSIKGFVETILNDPAMPAPEAARLLAIVKEQSDRINAIIDDLLSLARLEVETEDGTISREATPLVSIVQAAIKACDSKASKKSMHLSAEADENVISAVNASLLEEALVNLIDNAIKYSAAGKTVTIAVRAQAGENIIKVVDQGIGIPKQHLDRLFERFYRVDKARSRDSGGTGLGLSIVKHIMLAQGGSVTVESAEGRGSIFTLHLPRVTG